MANPPHILLFSLLLLPTQSNTAITISEDHQLWHALHHFEVLHKDHVRHSILSSRFRQLHFSTLGRDFHLLLSPKRDPLHRDLHVTVVGDSGTQEVMDIDPDHFLSGTLAGDQDSVVHAYFNHSEGLLSASILTQDEHYYIEPSQRHFSQSHDFHMISYKASDLKYNLTDDPNRHFCGSGHHSAPNHTPRHTLSSSTDNTLSLNKNAKHRGVVGFDSRSRLKRQSMSSAVTVCPLHLVATGLFHNQVSNENARNSIQLMVAVVDMVDHLYRTTEWSEDIGTRGLSISNITLFTSSLTGPAYNSRLPNGGWLSEDLLVSFSSHDWGHVCLAHLFTADTFTDNRLGVAYIASSDARIGGICSRPLRNFNGLPLSTGNVGVSSFLRDERQVLLAEAVLVVAHELGHNWGSEHDPTGGSDVQCNPSLNDGGKYLMFSSATDGEQRNNNRFSPCSRRDISDVLRAKSSTCFIEEVHSDCGNYAVDAGEQCDAGFEGTIGRDQCCDSNCHLQSHAVCSDVNEECCSGCVFANSSTTCRTYPANSPTCLKNVTCSGMNSSCPLEDDFVAVGTPCQGRGVCLPNNTQCGNSLPCSPASNSTLNQTLKCFDLCEQQNMTKCFCDPFTDDECRVCCRADVENSTCLPLNPIVLLEDRSICVGGECRRGVCTPITHDLASRLFDLFSNININVVLVFLSENIVGSVLLIATIFWVPISLIIHVIDLKAWDKFSKEADRQEQEQHRQNVEDKQDLDQLDTLAHTQPSAQIDTSQAKKALQRQFSRNDSIYSTDSFVLGDTYYFGTTSSKEEHGKKLPTIREYSADPEEKNILAFVRSGKEESESDPIELSPVSQSTTV